MDGPPRGVLKMAVYMWIPRRGTQPIPFQSREVEAEPFDSLILQGGGCRAFFTLGFLEAAGGSLLLAGVRQLATVSASAAMACAHLLGAHRESMELFAGHVKRNPKNFYLSRLLRGEWPMPHYAMYRKALLEAIPETHFPRIKDHPVRLRILISRAEQPSWAMAVGLGALSILTQERPPGLHVEVIDASELPSSLELIEAVLASSAFPPFTPLPRRGRQPLIDGGAIEPIPMAALDRNAGAVGRSLVILTRPTPVRPMPPGTLFVAPDGDPNLPIWDYADEPGLRRVYEMGLRSGERFLKSGKVRQSR